MSGDKIHWCIPEQHGGDGRSSMNDLWSLRVQVRDALYHDGELNHQQVVPHRCVGNKRWDWKETTQTYKYKVDINL